MSFAINQKEGLVELRRRQDEAGASSLGLYVKQLVSEHLAHDGDDAIARLTESVEQLRHATVQSASMLADVSRRISSLQTDNPNAEELEALRQALAVMFCGLLQETRPLTQEQAERIVRETFGENN